MPRTFGRRICHAYQWMAVCHVCVDAQYATFFGGWQYATYLWTQIMPRLSVDGSMPRISELTVYRIFGGRQSAKYLWTQSMPRLSVDGSVPRMFGCTVCHIFRWMTVCHVSLKAQYPKSVTGWREYATAPVLYKTATAEHFLPSVTAVLLRGIGRLQPFNVFRCS
jgi:hypothetical protein